MYNLNIFSLKEEEETGIGTGSKTDLIDEQIVEIEKVTFPFAGNRVKNQTIITLFVLPILIFTDVKLYMTRLPYPRYAWGFAKS